MEKHQATNEERDESKFCSENGFCSDGFCSDGFCSDVGSFLLFFSFFIFFFCFVSLI